MSKKSLVITLVAHQPYIRCPPQEQAAPEAELLFSAISDTYIPLLNMLERLDMDSVPFRLSLVLTPTLCALLADYEVQQRYVSWLEQGIALGEAEISSCPDDGPRSAAARSCLEAFRRSRDDFIMVYKCDLLSAFRYYADRGSIELVATCATSAFLPHYMDIPEAVNAQIEAGLHSHRQFFGVVPDGFWLPAMGYSDGLDKVLRGYGFHYTVLESHGLLFAEPCPPSGIFAPARTESGLVLFARDSSAEAQVSGERGFMWNGVYRDQDRDLAFEFSSPELDGLLARDGTRTASGYKYWCRAGGGSPWYDCAAASTQAKKDAEAFVESRREMLDRAGESLNTSGLSLVCVLDARVLGQRWHEGVDWLEQVLRVAAGCDDLQAAHAQSLMAERSALPRVAPFMSAATGTGYGENLLDKSNDWMLKYARKSCEQMVRLVDRFPDETGLKARVLNTAAKELLLAQSIDWPLMAHDRLFPECAEARFKESVRAFATVYDALGSTSISTEWLTDTEQARPVFPWISYQIFRRKK